MAHFYTTATGKAQTNATRAGNKNSGARTTCASYTLGVAVRAEWQEGRKRDLFTAYFDGGSGGPARAGRVDYYVTEDAHGQVHSHVEPTPEFMSRITEDAWRRAFADDEGFADRLRAMLVFRFAEAA